MSFFCRYASLHEVRVPFLCLIAEEEYVVNNAGAHALAQRAATPVSQRSLIGYPALHGLLCEPEPLRSQIERTIVEWVGERCGRG